MKIKSTSANKPSFRCCAGWSCAQFICRRYVPGDFETHPIKQRLNLGKSRMKANRKIKFFIIFLFYLALCLKLSQLCTEIGYFESKLLSLHYAAISIIFLSIILGKKYTFLLSSIFFCLFNIAMIAFLQCMNSSTGGGASFAGLMYLLYEPILVFMGFSAGFYLDKQQKKRQMKSDSCDPKQTE